MKRGQVGTTLTWFFAIIIIFFMSLVFLFFSIWIGGSEVDFLDYHKTNSLRANHELNYFLNYPVSESETIQDLIINWRKELNKWEEDKENRNIEIKKEIEEVISGEVSSEWKMFYIYIKTNIFSEFYKGVLRKSDYQELEESIFLSNMNRIKLNRGEFLELNKLSPYTVFNVEGRYVEVYVYVDWEEENE